jgi:hypothetical protein
VTILGAATVLHIVADPHNFEGRTEGIHRWLEREAFGEGALVPFSAHI